MKRLGVIIVCRSSNEPLVPGNSVGYQCKYCGERLQVTAKGLNWKATQYPDADFVCNPCGLHYAEVARQMGKLDGIEMSPRARAYFETEASKGNTVAQWIRKHQFGE